MNIIDEDSEETKGVEERQSMFGFKGVERVGSSRGSSSYYKPND